MVLMQCGDLIAVRLFYDLCDLPPEVQLHSRIFRDLLHQMIPQDMGIVGILLGEKSSVAQPRLEIFFHRKRLTRDPAIPAELQKFRRIRPGKMSGSSINLLKRGMKTEGIVLCKTLEISGGFHGRRQRPRVVISHVYPGLIDICGSGKRSLFHLQHLYLLPSFCTIQRRIQSIQPCSYDQFVHSAILSLSLIYLCLCFLIFRLPAGSAHQRHQIRQCQHHRIDISHLHRGA